MKKADQWSGLFLLLLSALICWGAYDLPYGKVRDPGPGFLPWWLGMILGMMSLALLLKSIWQEEKAKTLNKGVRIPGFPSVITSCRIQDDRVRRELGCKRRQRGKVQKQTLEIGLSR